MSRTLHLFGTDWGAMMVPIQVIRWYRMQCYDGTDSCAIVVPIRRYCHIILHKQANMGKTIIEKIEKYTDVGFGIVLYTPDDEGRVKGNSELSSRARQNVVFEHGYLIGKLGRDRVCALVVDNVEKPGDIDGIVYVNVDDNGYWKVALAKDMKAVGFNIDLNKAF